MADRVRVSQTLKLASLEARCRGFRSYQQANAAGLHPTIHSSLLNDIRPVQPNDPRVIAIGRVLGVAPEDCFEKVDR
jgi:hypothetical protein